MKQYTLGKCRSAVRLYELLTNRNVEPKVFSNLMSSLSKINRGFNYIAKIDDRSTRDSVSHAWLHECNSNRVDALTGLTDKEKEYLKAIVRYKFNEVR